MSWTRAMRALVVVLLIAGCGGTKGKAAAERAVVQFHQRLDRGEFEKIYRMTHADFKAASSEKDFTDVLAAIHRKLGTVQSSNEAGWRINSFNFNTNVLLTYKTRFADGDGVENFVFRVADAQVTMLGYNINSAALITK